MKNILAARLAVVRDVILQLFAGKLIADTGNVFGEGLSQLAYEYSDSNESAQKMLQAEPFCTVCARGSLIVSHVLRFNKMTLSQFALYRKSDAIRALPEFPEWLMSEVEILFEGKIFPWSVGDWRRNDRLAAFSGLNLMGLNDNTRLLTIMMMLLEGKGKIVLPVEKKKRRK